MRLPFNELQKAVVQRLATDIPSVPTYSPLAPADAARPFMTVSNFYAQDDSLKGRAVCMCTYSVHVWVDLEQSWLAINSAMNAATVAITRATLSLGNSFSEEYSRMSNAQVNPEVGEAGIVQHGILNFESRIVDRM
jgi:hypothetical protein